MSDTLLTIVSILSKYQGKIIFSTVNGIETENELYLQV